MEIKFQIFLARFEEYDITVFSKGTGYCASAVPSRLSTTFNAIWINVNGIRAEIPHPWKEVPEICKTITDPAD
jgi:hypothetical protein